MSENDLNLLDLARSLGYETTEQLLEQLSPTDQLVPGICVNDNCFHTQYVPPRASAERCNLCGTNTIKSALILRGD